MPWPTLNDYAEAIQNPPLCFGGPWGHEELRHCQVAFNTTLGQPQLWPGASGVVFKLSSPPSGTTWAVKCFTRKIDNLAGRYQIVSDHLQKARLPFTVSFTHLDKGILINAPHGPEWYPALKMDWVEGLSLNDVVAANLDKPAILAQLGVMWIKMARLLRQADIGHGDLQHGNVMLVKQANGNWALKLVDYDGMYVPGLEQAPSGELGHPNYQHPKRCNPFSLDIDRFSHLTIYTALRALAFRGPQCDGDGPQLWQEWDNRDNVLFRAEDFANPADSRLFQVLCQHSDDDVRALAGHLYLAAVGSIEYVPALDDVLIAQGQSVLPLSAH
jgi:hypothetical protein